MSRRIRNLKEFVEAVKMLPSALVIVGYAFLGAKAGFWLASNGWPAWTALLAIAVIMFFGMWQAYLFYTKWPKKPPEK